MCVVCVCVFVGGSSRIRLFCYCYYCCCCCFCFSILKIIAGRALNTKHIIYKIHMFWKKFHRHYYFWVCLCFCILFLMDISFIPFLNSNKNTKTSPIILHICIDVCVCVCVRAPIQDSIHIVFILIGFGHGLSQGLEIIYQSKWVFSYRWIWKCHQWILKFNLYISAIATT